MTALEKLTKARARLVLNHPFFGCLALNLVLEENTKIKTMATDGKRLIYSPQFVESLPDNHLLAVWAHEVLHCANRHMTRRQNRDSKLWNIACDYAINGDLVKAGFKLPPDALLNVKYDNLSAEQIYRILQEEESKKPKQKTGGASQSSGQGDSVSGKFSDPGGMGGVIDAAPSHNESEAKAIEAQWKALTNQAINIAKAQNAGNLPGYLERIADKIKSEPINWREELRRFIDSRCITDYSWMNPNRRFISQGLYFPGMIQDGIERLTCIIDCSGSISQKTLDKFSNEIETAVNDGGANCVTVIFTDTQVRSVQEFQRGDLIKLKTIGGGGTDFRDVFNKLEDIAPNSSAIIFLTDLYVTQFGQEPNAPVLWAVDAMPNRELNQPPFGEVLRLN